MSGVGGHWKAGWASSVGGSTITRILVQPCSSEFATGTHGHPRELQWGGGGRAPWGPV